MSDAPTTNYPTWEQEMLRLHRRNSWRIGWRELGVCLAVGAFLTWSLL